MIFALIALPARTLVAAATDPAALPSPPADSLVKPLPHWDTVPGPPLVWSPEALDWIAPAQATSKLSRLAFRWRYTVAEQVAIQVAETTHEDPAVRATLAILRLSLAEANDVDVTDPRTVQGVQYHAAVGLIAPDRVAQILTPP